MLRHTVPSTVITMNWTTKYQMPLLFLAEFETEQEYIDAMFIMIIMFNYGVWLYPHQLLERLD